MRATLHSGRTHKDGKKFNVSHNDRQFDSSNAKNIFSEKSNENIYWNWTKDENVSFADVEKKFFEENFMDAYEAQYKRWEKARQLTSRGKPFDEWIQAKRFIPEEVVLQVGKTGETLDHEKAHEFFDLYTEKLNALNESLGNPYTILDAAMHFDEGKESGVSDEDIPVHVHLRRVWHYTDKDGCLQAGEDKALKAAKIERPDLNKKEGRYNNRKMAYTQMERDLFYETANELGIELETSKQAWKPSMSKGEWLASEIKQTADEKAKVKEQMKEVVNTNHQQKALKAKVEAEKEQLDKDKADFQTEKQAQEQTFEQEKLSIESQKKEINQKEAVLSQAKLENDKLHEKLICDAQKASQSLTEASERLSESQDILKEAKSLKDYWNQMIAWAKKCTITVMGVTKRFGDWLSEKANQKKVEEKQENLNVRRNVTADKISKQKKDINALLAAHGLSDDASTEEKSQFGL